MIGKSLIGIYDNRLRSSTDRQKSVSKIWLVIGKGLDRRLRDRQKSKGKSLIGVSLIGKYLETTVDSLWTCSSGKYRRRALFWYINLISECL